MEAYTVSFFGHRKITGSIDIEQRLDSIIRELMRTKEYVEFLVGRNGEFDTLVSSVIRRSMAVLDYGNASHILVLPYQTADYKSNADAYKTYYTDIEICEVSCSAHFRAAIGLRNRAMVERSDMVVCYVERRSGGAYDAMLYAESIGRNTLNIQKMKF